MSLIRAVDNELILDCTQFGEAPYQSHGAERLNIVLFSQHGVIAQLYTDSISTIVVGLLTLPGIDHK